MSTPLTSDQWCIALEAEGLKPLYNAGWASYGRDTATGKPFGPVHGIVIHHTAGTDSRDLVRNGTKELPGPLAHAYIDKSGKLTMFSMHRANHAGSIAANAYTAIVNESRNHPRPDTSEPIDGNDCLYGIEIENLGNGKDVYPYIQYDGAVRWATAICRMHGWSADSVVGHKEVTRRKIDPSFNMDQFRADVTARLLHKPSWSSEETPVADTSPNGNETYSAVMKADAIPAPRNHPDVINGTNLYWAGETYARFIAESLIKIMKFLDIK